MKTIRTYWSFLILSLFAIPAFAGGGVATGDGFPRTQVEQVVLTGLPVRAELEKLAEGIATELPTFGYILNQTFARFAEGKTYRLVALQGEDPNFHASFGVSRKDGADGYPAEAAIYLWKSFYRLPKLAPVTEASQARAILHEVLHVIVTGFDEERTARLADSLYTLGSHEPTSLAELQAIRAELEPLVIPKDIAAVARIRELYERARGMQTSCAEMKTSAPITVGGKTFTQPLVPAGYLDRIPLDPHYAHYRRHCFRNADHGHLMVDWYGWGCDSSMGCWSVDRTMLFRDEDFRARLLRKLSGMKLRLEINRSGIELVDAEDFQNRLFANVRMLTDKRRTVTTAELEAVAPGYREWQKLYRANYRPDERGQEVFLDKGAISLFFLQWLKTFKVGETLRSGAIEIGGDARSCTVITASSTYSPGGSAEAFRIRCRFSSGERVLALTFNDAMDFWTKHPYENARYVGGEATLSEGWIYVLLEPTK